MSKTDPVHGGNLTEAEQRFGTPADGWLDLSTGINPFTYPETETDPLHFQRLPTAGELDALLQAARLYYRVPDGAAIAAVPGTQAALQLLPHMRARGSVAVLSPTYTEHSFTWASAGHEVIEPTDMGDLAGANVAVLVNPNNPDGRAHTASDVLGLAAGRTVDGRWLIVDEAFADTEAEVSVVPSAGEGGLLVLRSLGKFFGLAGLRLGFVVGEASLVEAIRTRIGPWAVGGAVLEIGTRALSDQAWIGGMLTTLSDARQHLDDVLSSHGLTIIGGTDLFRLVESDRAGQIYETLGQAGILVRPFPDHPRWLRFGLPGAAGNMARLENALTKI